MEYPLTTATICFVVAIILARALLSGGRRESAEARNLRRHYMRKGR